MFLLRCRRICKIIEVRGGLRSLPERLKGIKTMKRIFSAEAVLCAICTSRATVNLNFPVKQAIFDGDSARLASRVVVNRSDVAGVHTHPPSDGSGTVL